MGDRPQIHQSHLRQWGRCPYQRYLTMTVGPVPPGIAITIGRANHEAHEYDLGYKLETGELPDRDESEDIVRDHVNTQFVTGIHLSPEEQKRPERELRGAAVDRAVALNRIRHDFLALKINPTAVTWRWVVALNDQPYDLAGEVDYFDAGLPCDLKNLSARPKPVAFSLQATMYNFAVGVHTGQRPEMFRFDNLCHVRRAGTEQRRAVYKPQVVAVTDEHVEMLLRRVEAYIDALKSGSFPPTDPDNWWCGPRYCGYYANHCKYARG